MIQVALFVRLEAKPGKEKEVENFYELTRTRLNIWTATYQDMVLFIRTLETSPFGFRVDSWGGGLQDYKLQASGIGAMIELTYIQIKK